MLSPDNRVSNDIIPFLSSQTPELDMQQLSPKIQAYFAPTHTLDAAIFEARLRCLLDNMTVGERSKKEIHDVVATIFGDNVTTHHREIVEHSIEMRAAVRKLTFPTEGTYMCEGGNDETMDQTLRSRTTLPNRADTPEVRGGGPMQTQQYKLKTATTQNISDVGPIHDMRDQLETTPSAKPGGGCEYPLPGHSSLGALSPDLSKKLNNLLEQIEKKKKQVINCQPIHRQPLGNQSLPQRKSQRLTDTQLQEMYVRASRDQKHLQEYYLMTLSKLTAAERREQEAKREQVNLIMLGLDAIKRSRESRLKDEARNHSCCLHHFARSRMFQRTMYQKHSIYCLLKPEVNGYFSTAISKLRPLVERLLNSANDAMSLQMSRLFKDTLQTNKFSKRTLRLVHASREYARTHRMNSSNQTRQANGDTTTTQKVYKTIWGMDQSGGSGRIPIRNPDKVTKETSQTLASSYSVEELKRNDYTNSYSLQRPHGDSLSIPTGEHTQAQKMVEAVQITKSNLIYSKYVSKTLITTNGLRNRMSSIMKKLKSLKLLDDGSDDWKVPLIKLFRAMIQEWRQVLKSKKQDVNHQLISQERLPNEWELLDMKDILDPIAQKQISKKERLLKNVQSNLNKPKRTSRSIAFLLQQQEALHGELHLA
ncbi:hypothetical protein OXYTRIMIC_611 [Oxytricha trifallax]|uniref:Uncharacterized protein n=1 Tax=Oxytricha trifallax TaxID=1172189 RepID=A0A073HZC4_9SPIT|nr:hypothetical protein OXYTRIMIC_611 [Oxytricha trifallax]